MSSEPQLFRINPESQQSERIEEVDFARLGLQERKDIQEWIAANPSILGEDLLIIAKEFSNFDRTNERLDLLAVDANGKLVIIELKRDDTGADAHWQAIKYASYFHHVNLEDIIRMLAAYEEGSEEDAKQRLQEHLENDNLDILNNDQRIILASHRFAPEVTSAALWLNQKTSGEDLITCIQLTPYRDAKTDSLYIQANTIIPMPGTEDYIIQINGSENENGFSAGLHRTSQRDRQNDDVTIFLRKVRELALNDLQDELKPDRKSRWAGDDINYRYYGLWYSHSPWGNWKMCYYMYLYKDTSRKKAYIGLYCHEVNLLRDEVFSSDDMEVLKNTLKDISSDEDLSVESSKNVFKIGISCEGDALDEAFANTLAETLKRVIEIFTPTITDFLDERNEEGD